MRWKRKAAEHQRDEKQSESQRRPRDQFYMRSFHIFIFSFWLCERTLNVRGFPVREEGQVELSGDA
jgi:hypothetical protein